MLRQEKINQLEKSHELIGSSIQKLSQILGKEPPPSEVDFFIQAIDLDSWNISENQVSFNAFISGTIRFYAQDETVIQTENVQVGLNSFTIPDEALPENKGYIQFDKFTSVIPSNKRLRDYEHLIGLGTYASQVTRFPHADLISKEFNIISAAWEWQPSSNWKGIQDGINTYDWTKLDSLVDFCKQNNIGLHGHSMMWPHKNKTILPQFMKDGVHSFTPGEWVSHYNQWMTDILSRYVDQNLSNGEPLISSIDVVNEAVMENGDMYGGEFPTYYGQDYVANAFRFTKQFTGDRSRLYLNDNQIGFDGPQADTILEMVNDFLNRDVPIDGIGIQFHTGYGEYPGNYHIGNVLRRLVDTGLLIRFSEISINSFDRQIYQEMPQEFKIKQADRFRRVLEPYFEIVPPSQKGGICFWNLIDETSWLGGEYNFFPTPLSDLLEYRYTIPALAQMLNAHK